MLASNRLAGTHSHQDSRPGATRLEVGPRESRAGSRVPRHTQDSRPGATRLEVGPRESRAGSRVPRHTLSSPAVQATCQGGAVHAPGAPPGGAPHPTHKWKHHAPRWPSTLPRSGYARAQAEALCSTLVIPHPTHKWKHHAPRWPSTLPRSGYARAQAEALCSTLVINN